MRLGSETGSVNNWILSRQTIGQPEPFVGMGVTFLSWTDRDAGTIVSTTWKKTKAGEKCVGFVAQADEAVRVDKNGMTDSGQCYEFKPNTKGAIKSYRLDRKGQWRQVRANENGRQVFVDKGQSIRLGERDKYYDFSF